MLSLLSLNNSCIIIGKINGICVIRHHPPRYFSMRCCDNSLILRHLGMAGGYLSHDETADDLCNPNCFALQFK